MLFAKGTKMYSIAHKKCPHCHEGEFFVSRNPYNLSKAGEVNDNCSVCKRKLSIEPGFYYGAMYVAYTLAVAMYVSIYVATNVLYPSASTLVQILLIIGGLILTGPWLYALSKIIWANFFIAYKGVEPTEKEIRELAKKQVPKA
ncbi:MAG: DUF983 domain-containing protein [Flavobacteriales bacterium]